MKPVRLTTTGRITIPVSLRKKYGLTPGRRVRFTEERDGISITPLVTKEGIESETGFLGTKGKLLKSLMKEKKKERKKENINGHC